MNIHQLETQVKRLERKVRGMVVDVDDPRYAIYKKGKCTFSHEELKYKEYELIPVNKTALNIELEELYSEINDQGLRRLLMDHGLSPHFIEEKKEIERLKKLPIEKEKQIHTEDSQYLIYKLTHFGNNTGLEAYNKAAKELEERDTPIKEIKILVQMYEEKEKKRLQDLGFNSRYESQQIRQYNPAIPVLN